MVNITTAVIGGGVTASLIGYLSRHLTINLDLWESNEQLGGRMKTMKCDKLGTCVDIGAQYIITIIEASGDREVYSSLLKSQKIKPLTGNIIDMKPLPENAINYVAPQGMDSIVHHFVNSSNFRNIYLSRSAQKLIVGDRFVEITDQQGQTENYDAVIFTLPVPIFLNLEGNLKTVISEDIYKKLQNVEYSCRDCLALFFSEPLSASWSAKYLPRDSIFRYVAIQENKVGLPDVKSSVIFHTSIQFGEKYKTADDEITKSILIEHVRRLFPEFPDPIEVRHHKWDYSQILEPYDNTENNTKSLIIRNNPLIIIAGDAFATSNFDGCIASAESVADILKNYLENRNN